MNTNFYNGDESADVSFPEKLKTECKNNPYQNRHRWIGGEHQGIRVRVVQGTRQTS